MHPVEENRTRSASVSGRAERRTAESVRLTEFWNLLHGRLAEVRFSGSQNFAQRKNPAQKNAAGSAAPGHRARIHVNAPARCPDARKESDSGSETDVGRYRRHASEAVSIPDLLQLLGLHTEASDDPESESS